MSFSRRSKHYKSN